VVNPKETYRTEGLVIGTNPLNDADLIVRLLTPSHGKISCVAKSARKSAKRFGMQLDVFDLGTIEFQPSRGSLHSLINFIPQPSFRSLRLSLEKVAIASILCESLDHLLLDDGDSDPQPFHSLRASLELLDKATTIKDQLAVLFECLVLNLSHSGFAEPAEFAQRSAHSLEHLLNRVQESTERGLRSRSSVPMLVQSLRAAAKQTGATSTVDSAE
jgi:DNA repair protein RecO